MEALSGCERENKYMVYEIDNEGKGKGKNELFKCKEKSGFCAR